MKKVKVKDLQPGDVLASSGLIVTMPNRRSAKYPEYLIVNVTNVKGQNYDNYWKPNTTVSIIDK